MSFRIVPTLVFVLATSLIVLAAAPATFGGDWPRFRGPDADGSSPETGLFGESTTSGLALAWKQPLGSGYSGVAVAESAVVTMFSDGESSVMIAFDPENGEEIWRYKIGATYAGHDGSADGPISTPLIDGSRVFGLGPHGRLFALELASGRELWASDLVAEREARKPFYGFSTAPLLQEGVLIVQIGGKEAMVAGFEPDSGKLLWATGTDSVMHQSPIPLGFEGGGHVVVAGNTKLMGIDARTGEVQWEYDHGGGGPRGVWSLMPVPAGDGRLFLAHQDEASSMVQLERRDEVVHVSKLWETRAIKNSYNIPVYHDGYLYAFSTRILTCVDAATGEQVWRSREPGDGFMVFVDGHLVITTKKGGLHVVEATPEGYREVAGLTLFDDLAWTEPSIAGGSVYARSLSELARVDIRKGTTTMVVQETIPALGSTFPAFLARLVAASDADKKNKIDAFIASRPEFPIVEDNVVHFVYRGPGEDLAVAGDMIGARQEKSMSRVEGTDLFHYSMELDVDARANYLFMRDYESLTDPLNERKTESAVLTEDMEMAFAGETTEMSWFAMPDWKAPSFLGEPERQGRIEAHELESVSIGAKHSFDVYLPAGYDDGDRPYAVAYVHGGAAALERGRMPRALDNLLGTRVEPVIVVFIGAQPPMFGSPAPYAQMLIGELIPFVDETYRTIPSAEGRASLGNGSLAFPAWLCALMQPGVFGKVATQSGMFFDFAMGPLQSMLKTSTEQPLDLYVDWGKYGLRSSDEDFDLADASRALVALLIEKGYTPAGGEVHDGTGWSSWGNRTDAVFEALFPLGD